MVVPTTIHRPSILFPSALPARRQSFERVYAISINVFQALFSSPEYHNRMVNPTTIHPLSILFSLALPARRNHSRKLYTVSKLYVPQRRGKADGLMFKGGVRLLLVTSRGRSDTNSMQLIRDHFSRLNCGYIIQRSRLEVISRLNWLISFQLCAVFLDFSFLFLSF